MEENWQPACTLSYMNAKNGLIIAVFVAVTLVAIAGWVRKPSTSVPYETSASTTPLASANATRPTAYLDQNGSGGLVNQPRPIQGIDPCVPVSSSPNNPYYGSDNYRPVLQPALNSNGYVNDAYVSQRYERSIHRPVRIHRSEYVSNEVAVRQDGGYATHRDGGYSTHRGRSKGKSVAIVAGSAGVGAAIGAIAGGGKGAGIGALAGGGAGFIYDRLTHNHR